MHKGGPKGGPEILGFFEAGLQDARRDFSARAVRSCRAGVGRLRFFVRLHLPPKGGV